MKKISLFILSHITLILLIISLVVFGLVFDFFLTQNNIFSILETSSLKGPLVLGTALLMICGELDFSVGSSAACAGIVTALVGTALTPAMGEYAFAVGIVAALLFAGVIAAVNAFFVWKMKIPSLLATLATSKILYGICGLVCQGRRFTRFPKWLVSVADVKWFSFLPGIVGVAIITAIILALILKYTALGRNIYAVGGNIEAARLSGINAFFSKFMAFYFLHISAVVSGLLLCSYQGAASHNNAQDWPLDIISSAVVGGVSVYGGKGTITGTCLGLLLVNVLNNAVVGIGIGVFAKYIFQGALVLLVLMINSIKDKHAVVLAS